MNDRYPCEKWAEKLAARHQEDLAWHERQELEEHLLTCDACAAQDRIYQSLEARVRELPSPEMPRSLLPLLREVKQRKKLLPVPSMIEQPAVLNTATVGAQRRLALVVGIASDDRAQSQYAERDAREMAEFLQEHAGCDLVMPVFIEKNATRFNIEACIVHLSYLCTASDEVVIYFAGHGSWKQAEQRGHDVVLFADDSRELGAVSRTDSSPFSVEELKLVIKKSFIAKRLLLIVDECHTRSLRGEEGADESEQWIRERFAELYVGMEGSERSSEHELVQVASAIQRMICSTPDGAESLPELLRKAVLCEAKQEGSGSESNEVVDLQQVYRYLEQADE